MSEDPKTFFEKLLPTKNKELQNKIDEALQKVQSHIMGLRPFTSQLLCEQVVGGGLRRTSYEVNPEAGLFLHALMWITTTLSYQF